MRILYIIQALLLMIEVVTMSGCTKDAPYKLSVMADVEGSWDKVEYFINHSSVLNFRNTNYLSPNDVTLSNDNAKFIFLGDATDKGPHNIRILRLLVSLKERYGDRVILLLGNRDINKLRFNWELSQEGLKLPLPGRSNMGFRFAAWADAFADTYEVQSGAYLGGASAATLVSDQITKLKWILKNTLGAEHFFTNIKSELNENDEAKALKYILKYAKKKGDYHNYLRHAQMLYYDEQHKTLFAHGGIFSKQALGHIPNHERTNIKDVNDLKSWVRELNQWAQSLIDVAGTIDGSDEKAVKEVLPLITYQEPLGPVEIDAKGKVVWTGGHNNFSVVLGRPWDETNNLSLKNVPIAHLKNAGVERVVFGHTPIGEIPVFMKDESKFEAIAADTSFSKPPRVTAVEIDDENFVAIAAEAKIGVDTTASKIIYQSKSDEELGRSFTEGDRRVWKQGVSQQGRRVQVSFSGGGNFGRPLVKWVN